MKITPLAIVLVIGVAVAGCASQSTPATSKSAVGGLATSGATSSAASDWYTKAWGTFDAFTITGTSDTVIDLPTSSQGGWLTATTTGSGDFSIDGLNAKNEPTNDDLPQHGQYDSPQSYAGAGVFGADADYIPTKLQVHADGPWSITVHPISDAPELPSTGSGTGSGVYRYSGAAATIHMTNTGTSNFAVGQTSHAQSRAVLANTIGDYDGSFAMMKGPSVVTINSEGGRWTIG